MENNIGRKWFSTGKQQIPSDSEGGIKSAENKQQEKSPETKIFEVFKELESAFKNEKEFGEEKSKNGVKKIEEIEKVLRDFLDKFKDDYIKEYKYNSISPEKFMEVFGIGSLGKEGQGLGDKNIDEYNFEEIKKNLNRKEVKKSGVYERPVYSFHDFSFPIYKEYLLLEIPSKFSSSESSKTKMEEKTWFTPKQEKLLYEILTGNKNFDKESKELEIFNKSDTVIPGVKLSVGKEESPSFPKIKKEFLSQSNYSEKVSSLKLTPDFIKSYLEYIEKSIKS